jgi:SAM-dependent methyltransferase
MENIWENLVRCPQCKGAFGAIDESAAGSLSCPKCQAIYPIHDRILDLVPDLRFKRSLAQALMESPTIVKIYEGNRWRRSNWQQGALGIKFEQESAIIMQAADVKETSTVLDLACGTGIYTRPFALVARRGRVVGMDISMPMLEWASRKAAEEGVDNVVFLRARVPELPFDDAFFDCVNCCGALHLFPNADKAIKQIVRILKPGGRFTAGTIRRNTGFWGRFRSKSALAGGVNSFTPEGMKETLESLGISNVVIHYDAPRWMILGGVKRDDA